MAHSTSSQNSDRQRIRELREICRSYTTGSTLRYETITSPPPKLRIGLFGPTGVGKSAFVNSINYATQETWVDLAPEGFSSQQSKTLFREPFNVAPNMTLMDNRGMTSLKGEPLKEVGRQVAGARRDNEQVEWNRSGLQKLIAGWQGFFNESVDHQIHCAVLVVSAIMLGLKADNFKDLIELILKQTGFPPIVVITHAHHVDMKPDVVAAFKSGLQALRIDYVFELENYTRTNHQYDLQKHLFLLEVLYRFAIVGDKVMKRNEQQRQNAGWCSVM